MDQKVKSNQLVRDFKLKYNFGMIKNEILPSQKNDVLDGRRYAFLGSFGRFSSNGLAIVFKVKIKNSYLEHYILE